MKIPFSVNVPKIEKRETNRGEDAPPINKDGIMIICDGTGATGQEEHIIDGEVYTSAYLGSRKTALTAERFLSDNYDRITEAFGDSESMCEIVSELGKTVQKALSGYVQENQLTLTVRGKSFKLLPTTFVAIIYNVCEMHIDATVMCAGDSHALWWDLDGLHQLSFDDGKSERLVVGDCNISNCIAADCDFSLSFACYRLPAQGVLLATSDGFTDPIMPFDQERYLIEWIGNFSDISEENAHLLSEQIEVYLDKLGFTKRDDCSMAGIIVGYSSEDKLKGEFRKRYKTGLVEKYVMPYKQLNRRLNEIETEYSEAEMLLLEKDEQKSENSEECSEKECPEAERLETLQTLMGELIAEREGICEEYNLQHKKYLSNPLAEGVVLIKAGGEEQNGDN